MPPHRLHLGVCVEVDIWLKAWLMISLQLTSQMLRTACVLVAVQVCSALVRYLPHCGPSSWSECAIAFVAFSPSSPTTSPACRGLLPSCLSCYQVGGVDLSPGSCTSRPSVACHAGILMLNTTNCWLCCNTCRKISCRHIQICLNKYVSVTLCLETFNCHYFWHGCIISSGALTVLCKNTGPINLHL